MTMTDNDGFITNQIPPVEPQVHRIETTGEGDGRVTTILLSENGYTYEARMPAEQYEFVRKAVIEELALEAEHEPDGISSAWLRSKKRN